MGCLGFFQFWEGLRDTDGISFIRDAGVCFVTKAGFPFLALILAVKEPLTPKAILIEGRLEKTLITGIHRQLNLG